MAITAGETLYRRLATLFIAVVLFAQAATIPFTATRTGGMLWLRLYPIVEYDMYRDPHHEGDRVMASYLLEAVFADGQKLAVTQEMLGLGVWDFIGLIDGIIVHKLPARERQLADLVRTRVRGGGNIDHVLIKSLGVKVTRHGPESIEPEVLLSVPVQKSGGAVAVDKVTP